MSVNDQYALNWSNHTNHIRKAFDALLAGSEFVDVTLTCEGKKIGAHKMLLSACSTYFHELFRENPCQHPIVILKDVKFQNLVDILRFMYNGEVSVATENFDSFLKTAELLQVSGLTDDETRQGPGEKEEEGAEKSQVLLTEKSERPNVRPALVMKSIVCEAPKEKEVVKKRVNDSSIVEEGALQKKRKENELEADIEIKQEEADITLDEDDLEIKDPLELNQNESIEGLDMLQAAGSQKFSEVHDLLNAVAWRPSPLDGSMEYTTDSENDEICTPPDVEEAKVAAINIENEEICPPPDILEEAKVTSINSLAEKSRKKYETVYKVFMDWRSLKNITSFSENILLTYFGELSEKYKSSSLWAQYSMLRSTLSLNNNINIQNYPKLRAFLKRKSIGYQAKKAKPFTPDEINKFIHEAPDNIYLATKVALIVGIMGACHANELHAMRVEDFQDLGSAMLVTVPKSKTKIIRKFTITDHFYQICKKYANLRPADVASTSFFLNFQNGKCTCQKIGINKFGAMGKQVATFLKLPNPERYTGHSFRRSGISLR